MNGKELVKELQKRGWIIKDIKGSHYQMLNPSTGRKVPIPVHGSEDLPVGLLNKIKKQTGLK